MLHNIFWKEIIFKYSEKFCANLDNVYDISHFYLKFFTKLFQTVLFLLSFLQVFILLQ